MTSGVKLADINVSSAGVCAVCRRQIISGSAIVDRSGQSYHPEHFTCSDCGAPLTTQEHYSSEKKLYCVRCWTHRCQICGGCSKPILSGDKLDAMGKPWHTECFKCAKCGDKLDTFAVLDGAPVCLKHVAPSLVCAGCEKPITGQYINAMSKAWHSDHFVCATCRRPLSGAPFFEHKGKPYCSDHYHAAANALCANCGKPLSGTVVTAADRLWHPDCWFCTMCHAKLGDGAFMMKDGKPYCRKDYDQLFS